MMMPSIEAHILPSWRSLFVCSPVIKKMYAYSKMGNNSYSCIFYNLYNKTEDARPLTQSFWTSVRPWMTWCVNIWRLFMNVCCGRRKCEENSTKGCFWRHFCIDGFLIYFRMVGESPWRYSIEDRQTCEDIHICNTRARYSSQCSDRPSGKTHFCLLGILVHGLGRGQHIYIMP
jgi:hypothetical protein